MDTVRKLYEIQLITGTTCIECGKKNSEFRFVLVKKGHGPLCHHCIHPNRLNPLEYRILLREHLGNYYSGEKLAALYRLRGNDYRVRISGIRKVLEEVTAAFGFPEEIAATAGITISNLKDMRFAFTKACHVAALIFQRACQENGIAINTEAVVAMFYLSKPVFYEYRVKITPLLNGIVNDTGHEPGSTIHSAVSC